MQAVRRAAAVTRRALPLAVAGLVLAAGPAFAEDDTGKPPPSTTGGGNHNGTLQATAGVTITYPSGKPGTDGKQLTSVTTNWSPPPCWIGPIAGPAQFKQMVLNAVKDTAVPGQANYALEAMDELKRHYTEGYTWDGAGKGYKDFNLDQEGKGKFWGPVENPDSDSPDRFNCNSTIPFWVPNGELPPPGTPNVITPEMLSRIAYAHTQVPGVTIETSPTNDQTVNLPTWVWLRQKYTEVKVRASVDLGGGQSIWAETTATPTSVHIAPGTPDATVFPSSAECPIGPDGSVGAKYAGDTKADPPCGVTYLHSTDNAPPYQLNVTATWTVKWTGSNGTGQPLPNGVVTQPRPVTVREIQTVNR